MPDGVEVQVEGGYATIDFVDPARRGPGLAQLLAHTNPRDIEKLTRSGPRAARYRVPEACAKAAGLLDRKSRVDALEVPATSSATDATGATPPEGPSTRHLFAQTVRSGDAVGFNFGEAVSRALAASGVSSAAPVAATPVTGYDDGLPDMDWPRRAINDYAATLTPPLDTTGEPNKRAAIAAIEEAVSAGAKRPE